MVGAIVAAAGTGTRLGMGAKALLAIDGQTCLDRALRLFIGMDEVDKVVVVAPPAQVDQARRVVEATPSSKSVAVCAGGETRQQSVRSGLAALRDCDHVLVHDAARPLATPELTRRVLAAAVQYGASFPGVRPRDAVKRVEHGTLAESLDRDMLLLAQTPQAFSYEVLQRAHFEASDAGLVGDDDAQLVAASGHTVMAVEGDPRNLKLTTREDLIMIEAILRLEQASDPESCRAG